MFNVYICILNTTKDSTFLTQFPTNCHMLYQSLYSHLLYLPMKGLLCQLHKGGGATLVTAAESKASGRSRSLKSYSKCLTKNHISLWY